MSPSPARAVGVIAGALVILGIGVYGPATLLGPLPAVAVEPAGAPAAVETTELPLPEVGQTAVALVADGDGEVITATEGAEPQAIGAVAKLVTVLVVLDGQPLPTDGAGGATLTVSPQDYTDYYDLEQAGARVVPVDPSEQWSQRDVVRAILLGSSNNHAMMLAKWAYGTIDGYTSAADLWLADHGFESLRVDDATGLSEDNVGTAAEVARLGAMLVANPTLQEILDRGATITVGEHRVPDNVNHLGEAGVRALSRSYTNTGWLSFVFAVDLSAEGGDGGRAVAASLGMPDYDTLDPAMTALADAMRASAAPLAVIPEGGVFATAVSAWGDESNLIATNPQTIPAFASAPGEPVVDVPEEFSTAGRGDRVGTVSVPLEDGELTSPLALEQAIREPGVFWRLLHPIQMIGAMFAENA
ncbi:hypothetical protein [Agromyces seonyuensis]|uniref:Peptidase S11 D-alanyl-D-alanine carboxypeptidase A N-terminal domain-containing protein n=1 Tax=Agromyces seonyuensis TaxID=2662446 RepID=A0A6I4NWB7_9MICO|nr:hypothetical protein [Agromyces seonyuensis]MWB97382.1 hypothetical protein [Agromyces seonyuensis]